MRRRSHHVLMVFTFSWGLMINRIIQRFPNSQNVMPMFIQGSLSLFISFAVRLLCIDYLFIKCLFWRVLSPHFSWLIYRYENELYKFCKIMDFLLDSPPPEALHGDLSFHELLRDKMEKSVFWARCLRHVLSLGQKDLVYVSVYHKCYLLHKKRKENKCIGARFTIILIVMKNRW